MEQLKTTELSVIANNKPQEAAKILNFPVSKVYSVRKNYKIANRRRKYFAEDIVSIMERRSDGEKWDVIGKDYNASGNALRRSVERAKESGFDAFPKRPQ